MCFIGTRLRLIPVKRDTSMEEPNKEEVKMAGYLEKKGKMKVMAVWKQYWFVLEGHLLLYYRSQLEYLNLSACKGSLNMGLASSIRPGLNRPNIIEVVTPTKIITLKAKDRSVQEQWLQALLDSLATPPTTRISTGPMQLRYSLDNLPTAGAEVVTNGERPLITRRDSVLNRIRRLGGRTYAGGSLETVVRKPKLPKGQVVSRMLALQEPEACSTCDSVTEIRDENQNRNAETAKVNVNKENTDDSTEKLANNDPEADYYYIENKLYHKTQYQETDNILYNLKINVKENITDKEDGMYEQVPATTKTEESAAGNTDEEYYDSYDPIATAKRSTPSPEPDLPPRPRTFSNETTKSNAALQTQDDVEYADCTEIIKSNQDVKVADKKQDKKFGKKKMKTKTNKTKIKAANDESNTEKKEDIPYSKKRRMSFLKKVLGHYRKKNHNKDGDNVVGTDNADSNLEEPAYETVDFVVDAGDSGIVATESSPPGMTGISLIGKHSLMPNNALLELENKLQGRHISEQTARNNVSESITRDTKTKTADENIKADGKRTPPQLPQRQNETRRPSSPWHDVPTNNSPVDGKTQWPAEQQDSLLGTPQGFALLKSRWQAAERGGEWNKECHILLQNNADSATNEIRTQITDLYSKVYKKPKILQNDVDPNTRNSIANDPNPSPNSPDKHKESVGPFVDNSSANSLIFQMDIEDTEHGESSNFQQDSLTSTNCVKRTQRPSSKEDDHVPELPIKRQPHEGHRDNRYSNELNNLLAQLVQITSAPLMVPGNTTSLVDFPPSKLSEADEQLLLTAPVRRRRYSEPDYDVPRSHRYIFDSSTDTKNSALSMEEEHLDDISSCNISMAPDSLEPIPTGTKDKATDNYVTR